MRDRPDEPATAPNQDIRVPDRYLYEHEHAARIVSESIADAVFATPGAIDYDVREAIESLIRTHRTMQSGLLYESRPSNPVAASIYELAKEGMAQRRREFSQRAGVSVADAEFLGMLLILQRGEYRENNGRKRGRAFIDFLREHVPHRTPEGAADSPLILGA